MKFIFLGSNSDICKSYKKSINTNDNNIINISRSKNSDIYINWENEFKPFNKKALQKTKDWDILISFIGSQSPFGLINTLDPREIVRGLNINFSYQFAAISQLINYRNKNKESKIILFAGGGTNSAPTHYSVYITSKIGLIKFTELLSSEFENIHATIIGPGWVKTKIHNPTINEGNKKAEESYYETKRRFKENDFVEMSKVVKCINKVVYCKDDRFSGKNISVLHDEWHREDFLDDYSRKDSKYKLRRLT
tara:strand:+ start:280 stop:1032 length:753 start_codon:yes stop_codon:yes gene_type:complete